MKSFGKAFGLAIGCIGVAIFLFYFVLLVTA